ncbi:hypothetical protein ACWT_1180 [Actinoplanes sp. SE50]|uniref:hypothetical protein n=1 Tax=unclassified Actinoplanes TaxID=2626549 RepID=UPI00023ED1B7|nr:MULTISPECIES: hypothetical protein [unclassified Actinoplanes]AEV82196.1 hypothetical protein ACPL_1299 [Actinoplanes sp. SE50/110]ATO80595.1 hypothetical protein ACWT_1180 [Actinoplanes sp. SE50]SLL98001.1 uncharacterized protein ACSP50_1218 [Actinoplanes sp. SE50/110]
MTFPPDDPWGTPTPAPAGPPPTPPVPRPQPASPYEPPRQSGPVIVQIAEIEVTSSTIRTPAGDFPLAGSRWQVNEFWVTLRRTPLWAKIVGFAGMCFTFGLSLLLLLVKETAPQGTVQVTVTSGPQQYVARIAVNDEQDVITINQQVNYVRSLSAL